MQGLGSTTCMFGQRALMSQSSSIGFWWPSRRFCMSWAWPWRLRPRRNVEYVVHGLLRHRHFCLALHQPPPSPATDQTRDASFLGFFRFKFPTESSTTWRWLLSRSDQGLCSVRFLARFVCLMQSTRVVGTTTNVWVQLWFSGCPCCTFPQWQNPGRSKTIQLGIFQQFEIRNWNCSILKYLTNYRKKHQGLAHHETTPQYHCHMLFYLLWASDPCDWPIRSDFSKACPLPY